jgi:anthranilate synthase component II
MILLIDNYDSFTFNLKHYLAEVSGKEVLVHRNDKITIDEIKALNPTHIVLSPGPCSPNEAGICLEVVKNFAGVIPILGVCLGHQTIAQSYGGKVVRGSIPMHGKVSTITNSGQNLYSGLPKTFNVARYHSLITVDLPECLQVDSWTVDNVVMGVSHKTDKVYGVQFHPESIASEYGKEILKNFITTHI